MTENGKPFPVWLTLFTVTTVAILLALGSWQVQRLNWKLGLIAAREAAMAGDPVDLAVLQSVADTSALDFRRARGKGMLMPGKEVHVFASSADSKAGYHVFTPLMLSNGYAVLVNRGWVPPELKEPASRPDSLIAGPVTITGVVRLPQGRGAFTPEDDTDANIAYAADPAAFARTLGIGGLETRFYLVADREGTPTGGYPRGGQLKAELRNNHLIYAITWFSTGFAVAVAFVFYLVQRNRRKTAR
jgi:surfeit locus 1 family protein